MAAHAILSPSSASRWLACTPSARFESQFPDRAGAAAAEGTLAHSLGELLTKKELDLIKESDYKKQIKVITENEMYNSEMRGHAEDYKDFVIERFNAAKAVTPGATILLEYRLNLTSYVPEGFGTGDAIIIADGTMDFIDLKYGKGVPVFAKENKQMMLYGLAALWEFDTSFDIKKVRMTIYQPRIDNISEYEMSADDLKAWGEAELKPKAELAFEGKGDFIPGDHCLFCRAKASCKALADHQLEIAKYDFQEINKLTDEEVADILTRADSFGKWIKAIEDDALMQAVNNGKKWPGYKLVEGRSVRSFTDTEEVVKTLVKNGFEKAQLYKPQEVLGITALTTLIGKKKFSELLDPLTVKPPGKATLVPATDKRPELNSLEKAKADFAETVIDE